MNKKETLCWICKNAFSGNGCDWSTSFAPVEGWCAEKRNIGSNGVHSETYCVERCPLFEIDTRMEGKTCKNCIATKTCKKKKNGICSNFMETLYKH